MSEEEEEELFLVTFELRNGDYSDIDKVIVSKEDRYKYGEDWEKNHAHLIDGQYTLRQDEDWKEEWGSVEYEWRKWLLVEYSEGHAQIWEISPIPLEDAKILRKWGCA